MKSGFMLYTNIVSVQLMSPVLGFVLRRSGLKSLGGVSQMDF